MKKLSIAILSGLTLGSLGAAAAANPSVTTDFTFTSEYVFRGVKQAANSLQPSVELTSGMFNYGIWSNQPLTKNQNNEVDFYAGFNRDLSANLKLEGVTTYYYYPEARSSLGQTSESYEAGVGLTYKLGGFSPNVYYYHDFRLNSDTLQAAIGTSVPLEGLGSSLDISALYGSVMLRDGAPDASGPKFRDSYSYYGADVTMPWKLNTNATFTLGGHYIEIQGNALSGGPGGSIPKRSVWFTAGLSVGF